VQVLAVVERMLGSMRPSVLSPVDHSLRDNLRRCLQRAVGPERLERMSTIQLRDLRRQEAVLKDALEDFFGIVSFAP
jgi:hypothetical protein